MKDELQQLQLRLGQLAQRADHIQRPVTGRFISGEERSYALAAAKANQVSVSFFGGWDMAERVQVCCHPMEDAPAFTAVWVHIQWASRFVKMEHRALLGSLMSLGMDRSFLGDLVLQEKDAYLLVMPELAVRLPNEWTKAGSTTLRVSVLEEPPVLIPPHGTMVKDTVASLRLDCVVSSGLNLSRSKAGDMIRQGMVMVNHQPEERVDRLLEQGMLLSIRGYGRIRLTEVAAPTRKDRLPITLECFGKA